MPNYLAHVPAAGTELHRQQLLSQLHAQPRLPRAVVRQLDHDTGQAVVSANRINATAYVGFTGMQQVESLLNQKARIVTSIPVEDIGRRLEAEAHLAPIAEAMAAISVAEVFGLHRRCCE